MTQPVCKHPHGKGSKQCAPCARAWMKASRTIARRACTCGRTLHRSTEGDRCARCQRDAPAVSVDGVEGTEEQQIITRTVNHRVKTLADLIKVCEIDTTVWRITRYVCNKWDSAGINRNTQQAILTELYQVKVWLVPKLEVRAAKAEIAALLAEAKLVVPARPSLLVKAAPKISPYMLEIAIPDLHLGKLAWGQETGGEDYDRKIAERLYGQTLDALLDRVKGYTFAQIVLVVGNDFLNADNKSGLTTKGTPQDVDSRFQKTFVQGRELLTRGIDRLRGLAPVYVPVVPGNHDSLSAWHLGHSLECFFHKTADVTIDNAPSMRKYLQFGRVMLLWLHGDKGKHTDYPLLMATEQPAMFGATSFREAHLGHIHQTRVQEYHGVRVRVSPALCAPDFWHAESGFVGNQRAGEAYIWHREQGLVGTAIHTVT